MAKTHWQSLLERDRACAAILRRADWAVREYAPADEAHILELCRRVAGVASTPAEWRWRMFQNPAGTAVSLIAFLKESGRIVGHLAGVPVDVDVDGRTRKLFFVVDSVVDPAHQGRGINAVLTMTLSRKASDQAGGFIGGLPNAQAYGPNLKMGGVRIFTMPVYFRILDWRAVVRAGLHSNALARVAGLLTKPFQRSWLPNDTKSFAVRKVTGFDSKVDQLWNRIGTRVGICAHRKSDLLKWRYFDRPESDYIVLSVSDGDSWKGYAVLRLLEKWNLRLGAIVDLFFDPDYTSAGNLLLYHAEKYFRENRADVISGLFACPPEYRKVFRQAGFLKAPRIKGVRQFHFVADFVTIDSVRPDLLQRDGGLLRQESQWFFSLGDTDLV